MKRAILRALVLVVAGPGMNYLALGQDRCGNAPDYFQPTINSDGQRYPLEISPLVWHVVGSGVYAVKGSDGLTHLAFAMQVTNSWNLPATIQSVEVVDPSRNNKTTGRDRVISVKDEDVTGLMKLSSLPPSMDKASYSSKIAGGETGVMFFDVTYGDGNDVPCTIRAARPRCPARE
ncbi:MAG: hypothetical protein WAK48_20975 [Candidatus Acidiferrum sp.]